MNRNQCLDSRAMDGVPRASGDEPKTRTDPGFPLIVFPAPAGMNRTAPRRSLDVCSVPRASGDEPHRRTNRSFWSFSVPRASGDEPP